MNYFIKNNKKQNKGFTLIELIVVVSIVVIISALSLFNYSSFRSNVSLDNLSQDIALTVRQAQVYALGVQGTQVIGSSGNQFPAYGAHFRYSTNFNDTVHGNEKSFILFADLPPALGVAANKIYDEAGTLCSSASLSVGNECLQTNTITSTDYISELCVDSTCTSTSDIGYQPTLDIVFTRPNPDASFCLMDNSSICTTGSSASITITSTSTGATKVITVWNTGQISVQ